jgi:hypothetical protein
MMNEIPNCPDCGTPFENIFEATDHLLEDGDAEFNPELILPNGYSLMIGSLLRNIYKHSHDPHKVEDIAQDTYATLYAAQYDPGQMKNFIEDLIIREQMYDIDDELAELLDKNPKNDNESGE